LSIGFWKIFEKNFGKLYISIFLMGNIVFFYDEIAKINAKTLENRIII